MSRSIIWIFFPVLIFVFGSFAYLGEVVPELLAAEHFEAEGVVVVDLPGYKFGLAHMLSVQSARPYVSVLELVFLPSSRCEMSGVMASCRSLVLSDGYEVVVRGRLYDNRVMVRELTVR